MKRKEKRSALVCLIIYGMPHSTANLAALKILFKINTISVDCLRPVKISHYVYLELLKVVMYVIAMDAFPQAIPIPRVCLRGTTD